MKILISILSFAFCSCQATKKAGDCSTKTGFAVMDAGVKPIGIVDKVEGPARIPAKVLTLPIQLVTAGGGLVIGAPFLAFGAILGDDW